MTLTPDQMAAIVKRDQEWLVGFREDPEVGDEYLEGHDETECQADRDRHELLMELLTRDAREAEREEGDAVVAYVLQRAAQERARRAAEGVVPTLRSVGYEPACDYCDEGDPIVDGYHIRIDPEGIDPTAKVPCPRAAR